MTRLAFALIVSACLFPSLTWAADRWITCAQQDQQCDVDGMGIVRYGVDGSWDYRVITDNVICDGRFFRDPAAGAAKSCQRLEMLDEVARLDETELLRAQLQQAQERLQEQEQYAAELEQELAGRQERRPRQERRRERRETFGPVFEFRR